MPIPLADSIAAALSDRTTALAAAFIIGTRHADVLTWVAKTVCGDEPSRVEPQPARPNGGRVRHATKRSGSNGHRKPRAADRRIAKRDADDTALIAAMKSNPDGTIGEWSATVGKSKGSITTALHRLRDAGLAESRDGSWKLVEQSAPREPPEKWVRAIGATEKAVERHFA